MYKVGDIVEFIDAEAHLSHPGWYPPVGTRGEVTRVNTDGVWVKWPNGSTSFDDKWEANNEYVRLVSNHRTPIKNLTLGENKAVYTQEMTCTEVCTFTDGNTITNYNVQRDIAIIREVESTVYDHIANEIIIKLKPTDQNRSQNAT